MNFSNKEVKAIMGLGNPGPKFAFTPHNIGFLVVDQLADEQQAVWHEKQNMFQARIQLQDHDLLLIKPQTFMNDSGKVLSILVKQGIKLENILVVHDEIDFEFGKVAIKDGGSARGHNGLRSLIAHAGQDFLRVRCGVGRPNNLEDVGDFVTALFIQSKQDVEQLIDRAIEKIELVFKTAK